MQKKGCKKNAVNKNERKKMNWKWKNFNKESIILDVVYVLDLYK
jgi:hypothetical protein